MKKTLTPSANSNNTINRKAVLRAAVWSTPVIAVAVAAPSAMASGCTSSGSYVAPAPSSGPGAAISSFTVPEGVTTLTFTVVGGAGGVASVVSQRNQGRSVTGQITVTPGQELSLIVGQGGASTGAYVAGGEGYGDGGTVNFSSQPAADRSEYAYGGSGGGGSAILTGASPLVVAGAGAGHGTYATVIRGGDERFEAENSATTSALNQGSGFRTISAAVGDPGIGATPGGGGTVHAVTGTVLSTPQDVDGVSGVGGDGADAVEGVLEGSIPATWRAGVVSGAAGGGYAGGGSGAVTSAFWTTSGAYGSAVVALAGGGGVGSSFWANTVTATESVGNNAKRIAGRSPGSITLSWVC